MGQLVNAAIPFIVGVYVLLVSFRLVGGKPGANPKVDELHARYGLLLKLLGVACILLAVFYLVIDSGRR